MHYLPGKEKQLVRVFFYSFLSPPVYMHGWLACIVFCMPQTRENRQKIRQMSHDGICSPKSPIPRFPPTCPWHAKPLLEEKGKTLIACGLTSLSSCTLYLLWYCAPLIIDGFILTFSLLYMTFTFSESKGHHSLKIVKKKKKKKKMVKKTNLMQGQNL